MKKRLPVWSTAIFWLSLVPLILFCAEMQHEGLGFSAVPLIMMAVPGAAVGFVCTAVLCGIFFSAWRKARRRSFFRS